MIRLLGVELTRLRWRRAVLVLLGVAVIAPVLTLATIAWDTRPSTDAEIARAERMAERDAGQRYVQRDLARCERKPEDYFGPGSVPDDVTAACEESVVPQAEWYLQRTPLDVQSQTEETVVAVVVLVAVLLLLVGTTFAGHDWNTGSMGNQLIFEPGRLRLWTAKLLAVGLTSAVVGAILLAAYWGGLLALAASRDIDVGGAVVREGTEVVLRGIGFCLAAGVLGYLLSMLFRSTVAALGLMIGVAVAVPVVIGLLSFPGYLEVLPQNNVIGWVLGEAEFVDYSSDECVNGDPATVPGCTATITATESGLRMGGSLLLLGALSAWSFRRRDVG